MSLSSCFVNFYRPNTKTSIDASSVSRLSSEKKYFIIHFIDSISGLENVYAKDSSIYGRLVRLPGEHSKHLHPNPQDKAVKIKSKYKEDALSEVHLYINSNLPTSDSIYSASVTSFYRTDIYKFNKGATTENHIVSVFGLTVGTLFVAMMTLFIISPPL